MNHPANEHHRMLIDAVTEAGVKHLIPNHWSNNAELPIVRHLSSRFESLDGDIEYLRTKEASRMTWTAIVTGTFLKCKYCSAGRSGLWSLSSATVHFHLVFWGLTYAIARHKSGTVGTRVSQRLPTKVLLLLHSLSYKCRRGEKQLCVHLFLREHTESTTGLRGSSKRAEMDHGECDTGR